MAALPDDPRGLKELHPELDSPCGSQSHPIVSELDACRPSPPSKPSSTLRLGGMGTNGNILHVVSGGDPSDAPPDGPCGLKGLPPDWDHDACRLDPRVEPPSPCLSSSRAPTAASCTLLAEDQPSAPSQSTLAVGRLRLRTLTVLDIRGHSFATFNPRSCHPSWHLWFISRLWDFSRMWLATSPPFHPQRLLPPPSSPTPVP